MSGDERRRAGGNGRWLAALVLSIASGAAAGDSAPDPAGGLGGAPLNGSLSVRVIAADTNDPIAGAFVMVGASAGSPFENNVGVTDGSGEIQFADPALVGSVTVTGGGVDRVYVSYVGVPVAEIVLALPSFEPMPTVSVGDAFANIEVNNGFLCAGDGNLDLGFVFPGLALDRVLEGSGLLDLFFSNDNEPISTPLGAVEVPSNIYAPMQCELFGSYQKPFYHLSLPPGQRSLYGLTIRAPLSSLLDLAGAEELDVNALAALLADIEFREADVLRDLDIQESTDDADLSADLGLVPNLTLEVSNARPATTVIGAGGGRLSTPDGEDELMVTGFGAFDPDAVGSAASLTVTTLAATGELSDLIHGALVAQLEDDDGSGRSGSTTALARSGITPPGNVVFDSFFDIVAPQTSSGTTFSWNDVRSPTSPAARDLNRSQLIYELELPDPGDPTQTVTESAVYWVLFAPGELEGLSLPELPTSAPTVLPDPNATTEQDRLAFALEVYFLGDRPTAFDYASFAVRDVARFATHVSSDSLGLACDSVSEVSNVRLAKLSGQDVVALSWDPSLDICHDGLGASGYEVFATDDPVPLAEPGDWPTDPTFFAVTDDDLDGSMADTSFSHVPPAGFVAYLVVDRGLSGNQGPSGHYGSTAAAGR